MSWKNLKILAIAILLAMDVFFLYSLIEREHAAQYYDRELVDAATEIFRESSIYIDESFLTARIISLPVYSGAMDETFFDALTEKMEAEGYTAESGPGGMSFLGAGEEFYIGNDFTFLYQGNGGYERPSALLAAGTFEEYTSGDFSWAQRAAEDFLSAHCQFSVEERTRFHYTLSYDAFYQSGEDSILCVTQKVGGRDTGNRLYMLFSEGRIVSADGRFAMISPQRKMTAQTVGLMEILFAEKDYLDEIYRQSGAVSRENKVLIAVTDSYEVYFDADGTFYYVPVFKLTYQDGETRTYNSVLGEIYS